MKTTLQELQQQLLKAMWLAASMLSVAPAALAQPDLKGYSAAYSFDVQESAANWGDNITLQFAVLNSGNSAAGPFKVGIYISADTTIGDASDYLVTKVNFNSGLNAGYYGYLSYTAIPLPSVNPLPGQPTTVYVGMVVDVDNQVGESDEGNNKNLGGGIDRDDTPVTITPPKPDIFVTDSVLPGNDRTVPFADVADDGPGNARGVQTVTIINKGKGTLNIANLALTGSPYFSLVQIASSIQNFISPSSLPRTIAKNGTESWTLTLQFDPATNAPASGTLTITSDDPNTPSLTVSLTGTGRPVPDIALTTPEAVETDFGAVVQDGTGGASSTQTIVVKNVGSGPLTVSQNGISLLTGTHYSLVSVTSSTQEAINLASGPQTIAARSAETWSIVLRFDPAAMGQLNDGLRIASDDPDESTFVVSLRGKGVAPMQLQVTDSSGDTNDHSVTFPDVHADGPGKQKATATLTLKNSGEAPLTVLRNGVTLTTGTDFRIEGITSSMAGPIDLSTGAKQIAGTNFGIWTVVVAFDPAVAGTLSDTLTIRSDDPAAPAVVVSLAGQGISRPALTVSDSVLPADDLAVSFGAVLNDGPGGRDARQTVTLTDIGAQPVIVAQNGLSLSGGPGFSIVSMISSTRGAVDVSSANPTDRTIASAQNETWTVTLAFDPTANGPSTETLDISSNDTNQPIVHLSLTATGATPAITLTTPALPLNVSAGSVFNFAWQYTYPGTNAVLALYLDTDANPATGLIPIATGIPADTAGSSYAWRVDPALAGSNYFVYATITDGSVTRGGYAPATLRIDPLGAFQLRSSREVTSADYGYEYEYNGQLYLGVTHLAPGDNTVTVSTALPGGDTSTFQFAVKLVPSLIHTETVKHDELNRVQEVKNGNGIVTRLTYDQMGRVIRRESDNGAVVEFAYDVLGRRTRMTDYTGTTFYEWDDLSRLTAVITSKNAIKGDSDDLPLRYEYDLAGRQTAIVYPGGERIQYTYDNAGRMLTVNNVTRSLLFSYTYNPTNGLLTKLSRPNGIDTLYSYDGMGRVTTLHHQKSGGTLVADFSYGLDAAGKATNFVTTLPGGVTKREQYAYDRFDRLVQAVYADNGVVDANSRRVDYTYDGNGNRLTMTTTSNNVVTQILTYHCGNENRLLSITDQGGAVVAQFSYDAAGNCIQKITPEKTTFYSFDERNLLTSVVDGTNHVVFAYNGDGQRIAKTVNGVPTTFVVDANRRIFETVEERGASGAVAGSFTFGGRRLSSFAGAAADFELPDRLGSVRYLTDPTGAITDSYAYDAFGAVTVLAGSPKSYAFDGERLDPETGLIFLRARFYAPAAGRFMSKDPLGIGGGLNGYIYCANNSVNRLDPAGLDSQYGSGTQFQREGNTVALYDSAVGPNEQSEAQFYSDHAIDIRGDWQTQLSQLTDSGKLPVDKVIIVGHGYYDQMGFGDAPLSASDVNTIAAFTSRIDLRGCLVGASEAPGLGGLGAASITPNLLVGSHPGLEITAYTGLTMVQGYSSGNVRGSYNQGTGITTDSGSSSLRLVETPEYVTFGGRLYNIDTIGNSGGSVQNKLGGVLLDKAAQLVGSNLSDIRGAMYDPVSGQFVFLGTDGAAGVKDINLAYLYTALQAVYGSAVPPFVTLDPPASAYTQWIDFGDGDGIFEPGEKGGFLLRYNPIWSEVDTTVDVTIKAEWSGTYYNWTARFDCVPQGIYAGGRRAMKLVFNSWVSAPPSGVTLNTTPWLNNVWSESCLTLNQDEQNFLGRFTLNNATTGNFLVTDVRVVPARQHRKYGGRVDGTRLGWVMLEADRVMKCLGVGKDNLTGAAYNSGTVTVPGFHNLPQRGVVGNIRFWFTPNEMTLKRHLDPETGRASIVFDRATVALNTESFMMGLPQSPEARAFADHFTSNYDAFAALSFPCVDPNDQTGQNIVQVKVFKMLKDAMQSVSLARFFRDNDVPVDMWWLNSWQPPVAYSPKSTPTAYNEENGIVISGGVQVNKPNAYVPSATAKSVADVVQSSRPSVPADLSADIKQQVWSTSTTEGALRAVATQTTAEPQDGIVRLAEVDLNFASSGALPLQFVRYYQSAWLGRFQMGPSWRYTPFMLEFERPSWFDENSLMRNGTNVVWKDSRKDTRLRSGTVRVVDLRSGAALDFASSLELGYAVDNIGNAVITVSGLDTNGLPTFTPGQRQSGASLVQLTDQRKYQFTTPDGSQIIFDTEGRLLQTQDRNALAQTYSYDSKSYLTNIADSAGQKLTLTYDTNAWRVVSVTGPASEQVNYTYTNGCLARATHVRSGGYVTYQYNTNSQLVGKTLYNGLNVLQAQPDLRGRPNLAADIRGNTVVQAFSQDSSGTVRTTETTDPQITDPAFQPRRRDFDRNGRLLAASDVTGAETFLGYDEGSLAPNYIDLPIAGRPTISIERNELGQPTRVNDPGNFGAQDVTATYDSVTKLLLYSTDEAGRNTEITYNANNSVARVRRQLGGQNVDTSFGYFATGALRTKSNALGIPVVTYYRDSVDRATNVVDATGVAISYQYDSLGRLWKVRDPRLSTPVEYVYDNFDRVIEIRYPVGSVFSTYDPVKGWLVSQTDLLGRVTRYVRDPQNGDILQTIDEVAGGSNRVTTMTYNRYGQLATITPPDAQRISFNYDQLGRSLGSSEMDARPPGAPKVIVSDHAQDGVPTTATNHIFTWGAPDSDSGIAGYSYAYDQAPGTNINTTIATATWTDVAVGTHTFQVRAKGNNGLWGTAGVFGLIIEGIGAPGYWTNWTVLPDWNAQLEFHGSPGARYIIQRGTNLGGPSVIWTDVGTNTADGQGRFIYQDQHSTNFPEKYYRSRTP